eukprot:7388824-Prymnesium_polylepis.3
MRRCVAAAGRYNPTPGALNIKECERCGTGQDSVSGSATCTICAKNFFRSSAAASVDECSSCNSTLRGVACGSNATIQTLRLDYGYWRHSTATPQTWRCKLTGGWSPCRGGIDAGSGGDGYCHSGYRGARCEVCDGDSSEYFDKADKRCYSCRDRTLVATAVCTPILFLLLATVASTAAIKRCGRCAATREGILLLAERVNMCWKEAGMRFKVKAIIGIWQCIAPVPSVFGVTAPFGLERYIEWMELIEFDFSTDVLIPAACVGSYRSRVLISSCWPIVLVFATAVCCIGREFVRNRASVQPGEVDMHSRGSSALVARASSVLRLGRIASALRLSRPESRVPETARSTPGTANETELVVESSVTKLNFPRSTRAILRAGLQQTLPLMLVVTFVLVPSTATRIFQTFLCGSYEYDAVAGVTKRYLREDPNLGISAGTPTAAVCTRSD